MKGLHSLDSWNGAGSYNPRTSAQGYLGSGPSATTAGPGGSSCGAGDKPKVPEPKPSACSSSCGAGDKPKQPEPKPGACGSSCGAGDTPKK
jgi:ACGX-repeat protein